MRLGADYYPEQWDRSRWATDAEMMKAAGIRLIRIAEFTWSLSEKSEGKFDFSWIDEIIGFFGKFGIKVVMCTPTACPPKWMVDRYPDILQEDRYNRVRHFGSRRHYCFNSRIYREKSAAMVERLAVHFKDNPNIEAWQIDNEFGCQDTTYCYCGNCRREFQKWLTEKYGTVENLNSLYGTVFWGQTYGSFDEIELPKASTCEDSCPDTRGQNPSLYLDFKRFSSDSAISFQKMQADLIKKHAQVPVTTNFMGSFSEIDYFKLASDLDFVSWDNYRDTQWGRGCAADGSMDHALMRSLKKKPMWVMEQQSGPCGWGKMGANPEPGKLRLWTYQAIANGADTIVYFRWRAALFGTEQYWHGILDHDGEENRRYREIASVGAELEKLDKLLPSLETKPAVAIVKHYDSFWSHSIHPHADGFSPYAMLGETYHALYSRGINTDFVDPREDLARYKVVFAPALNVVDKRMTDNLETYVRNGGTLVLTYRSGTRTEYNTMYPMKAPGAFSNLVGANAVDFDPQSGRNVDVSGVFGTGTAAVWCDIVKTETARAIGRYAGHHYSGMPAVTVNDFGRGKAYYIGCDLGRTAFRRLTDIILDQSGIQTEFMYPVNDVEISDMTSMGRKVFFVMNHNDGAVMLKIENEYHELLTDTRAKDVLELGPYGVAVLVR